MNLPVLLPQLRGLHLECVEVVGDQVEIEVAAQQPAARCPLCGIPSTHVHSRYQRTVADLPCGGRRVRLLLHTRRFRCAVATCRRRIFCERLTGLVKAYARRTQGLKAALTAIGFALGGRPGTRLAQQLQLEASRTSLLRFVRAAPEGLPPVPRVLGVDEWAFRRGRQFGTILVDLERHRAVELLPEATATSLAQWLEAQEAVAVISRDRGGALAEGARRGAPQATQVADRFHLLKNLGDAVERVLRRHADLVQQVAAPDTASLSTDRLRPDRRASRERVRQEMAQRFATIQRLKAQGRSISATARELGWHRHTVQKYWRLEMAPQRRYTRRGSGALAAYEPYLRGEWSRGQPTARSLWRAIVARGYSGAYENVARYVAALKHAERAGEPTPVTGLTPRQVVILALRRPAQQTPAEREAVAQVQALHPELGAAIGLLVRFAQLIRQRTRHRFPADLEHWLSDAAEAGVPELAASVVKLKQDRRAVLAAFELPYSQGQTEGQITRLKALKRAMFGRANFDLLRKRFLAAS